MKKLITCVLMAALLCVPSIARAAIPAQPTAAVAEGPGARPRASAPVDDSVSSTPNYAAREAATPQLADFEGGRGGIWIGTGALVVIAIVLIVVFVH
ncbi:MAG TPA: hypothetical protein VJ860_00595 [Polyangia bacterium]|nr:hypothetical protein [Polyangia bacterium]